MAIDVALLAASVVAKFLMPYAKKGAEKLSEEIGKTLGASAATQAVDVAKRIWTRVKSVFSSSKEQTTLALFTEDPETYGTALEKLLVERLRRDPDLAAELQGLVGASMGGERTAVEIMAETVGYVDARGATISGTVGGIVYDRRPTDAESLSGSEPGAPDAHE